MFRFPETNIVEIPVEVTIRKVKTGEVRVYKTTEYLDNGVWCDFNWSESNYACDCNRELFFKRAAGQNTQFSIRSCTHGRYIVESIVRTDTGEKLYTELP
jgi:hypothetical protein